MVAKNIQEARALAISKLRRLSDAAQRKGDFLRAKKFQAGADFLEEELLEDRARRGWSQEDRAVEMILEGDGSDALY